MLITGIAGVALGLVAGVLYIRAVEDNGDGLPPRKVETGTAITIGLAALALVRQVASLGEPDDA